ncbi:MAG TPA: ATP-binding protein [Pseudonocardiaceae bacterium]|nr:ATP-binding protein [Pseudonocardiaceae bacterium]
MSELAIVDEPAGAARPWTFIGRTEQLTRVVDGVDSAGLVLVTGQPGMGRTTMLCLALLRADVGAASMVWVDAAQAGQSHALAPFLAGRLGTRPAEVSAAAEELALVLGHGALLLVDDAHLVDLSSMLVLRELRRGFGARLLLSAPHLGPGPDPIDCLRYDRDLVVVDLPPLSDEHVGAMLEHVVARPVRPATAAAVRALTGGCPRRLYDLLVAHGLGARIAAGDGQPVLPPGWCSGEDTYRLTAAMADAWSVLDLDTVVEMGRLAGELGATGTVVAMHASALLLSGHAAEAERLLAGCADDCRDEDVWCRVIVTRALTWAFGLGRMAAARRMLASSAQRATRRRVRLECYRAWLHALDGNVPDALRCLESAHGGRDDREAGLIASATQAAVALAGGVPADAVAGLRRAMALSDGLRCELPWLDPYLRACLVDALLLAGRGREAASVAAELDATRRSQPGLTG